MKKNLIFVTGSLRKGGAERVISKLANHYSSRFNVIIVTLLDDKVQYQLKPDVVIEDISRTNIHFNSLNLPIWLYKLRRIYKKYNPHRVISFIGRVNVIAMAAGLGGKFSFIVSERNDPLLDGRSKINLYLTMFLYRQAYRVVYQTNKAKDSFKSDKIKSLIIPNPIDIKVVKFTTSSSRKARLITVGRLEDQKNISFLIDVIHNLVLKYKLIENIDVSIFGCGSLENELKKKARDLGLDGTINFRGLTDDVESELVQHDIFVMTSKYEGFSNALIEAIGAGLPIIVTNVNGADELIFNQFNLDVGDLIEQGETASFSKAIYNRIVQLNSGKSFSKNCHAVGALYSSDRILEKWDQVVY